ncbi:MAG: hypothetical protein M1828_000543 [Chrysothrix sp. TS-e1954]|nr:MAG: hypothetical protein M1828_000543 [Chrysothrix sp. TS-e1954]
MSDESTSWELKIKRRYLRLWKEGIYSDVEVITSKTAFHLHKVVLDEVDFFAAAFKPIYQEGKTSKIRLEEDDPDAVAAMLEWLYTDKYKPKVPHFISSSRLTKACCYGAHVAVYVLAEKYGLEGLKSFASQSFKAEMKSDNLLSWKLHVEGESPAFLRAVKSLYKTTPDHERQLKDIILRYATHLLCNLIRDSLKLSGRASPVESADALVENRRLLNEMPEFLVDLVAANTLCTPAPKRKLNDAVI